MMDFNTILLKKLIEGNFRLEPEKTQHFQLRRSKMKEHNKSV